MVGNATNEELVASVGVEEFVTLSSSSAKRPQGPGINATVRWLTLVTISGNLAARALPARDAPAMARENFIVQREEKNWRMSVEKRRSVNQRLITKIVGDVNRS